MRRREFIALGGASLAGRAIAGGVAASIVLASWKAWSQGSNRRPLMGWLSFAPRAAVAAVMSALQDGLRELGYEDGRNLDIAYRFADDHFERLPTLARELVQLAPDILYAAASSTAVLAFREATQIIPIVCPTLVNEVRLGLVESHARPGHNVTGISLFVDGLIGKQVELAARMIPGVSKVGYLANVGEAAVEAGAIHQWQEAETAGAALSIKIVRAETRTRDDLVAAVNRLASEGSQAVIVSGDPLFFAERRHLAELALAVRLPFVYVSRDWIEAGGLVSYGGSTRDAHRRAAAYVVKILKGAKPGDLPIEFPAKLELVINLKTAKALGLAIPSSLLAQADEVIE
jgi:putative tryptophan/tyrosine transport system substrate-binding protein